MAHIKYKQDFRTMEERIKRLREVSILECIHYISLKYPPPDSVLQEYPGDVLFIKAMRNASVREASTFLKIL